MDIRNKLALRRQEYNRRQATAARIKSALLKGTIIGLLAALFWSTL